ncbi:MAG: B12-binding domain-containing radical SAM protein [Lachnospiraceae bacterium]|nr:B12-binding domain-containing radical SAM protein [Lachnospiraceae bacterium]
MKFLLAAVNAKYIHSNPALYSLRAYAGDEAQPHIEIAEYTINQRMQDILADIFRRKPDAVGFSCYIWNWKQIGELIPEVKKVLPDADIWLGGPEVSFDAPKVLEALASVKGVMVGEGEETFRELMQWYLTGGALEEIAGLCLPTGYTAPRPPVEMRKIPFLYQELDAFSNKILYYESSRGCPYRCSYCLSSIDKRVRLRDLEIVRRELQFFLDHKVRQVKFIDRTFNCNHAHAMGIWQYILAHDNGVTNFHFEISADKLQEDALDLLRRFRPGLAQLEIGVQTTNPETLRAIRRVMDIERLEHVVETIRQGRNIHQHLDLIAGLPYEDYDSFVRSFNRVYAMCPQQLQLGFLKVLKGSPMEEMAAEYGIAYLSTPPYEVLYTKWLSYEEILRLKQVEEMVELYYNSNQFTATIAFLECAFAHPFALYEALAAYYQQNGYFLESPARAYRYEVLLAFAAEADPDYVACYRELLTYDLYLRENLKSRPSYAQDLQRQDVKDFVRQFYRTEERERVYLPTYAAYDSRQMSKMTHLEPFVYPVWDVAQMRQIRGKAHGEHGTQGIKAADSAISGYILFDYQKRDPLTYEAHTQWISPGQTVSISVARDTQGYEERV